MAKPRKPARLVGEELFEYAVRQLTARPFSTEELRRKLGLRAANAEDVDRALARLRDAAYLDDRKYAENFAAARAANDGFGRLRILQELRARKVPDAVAGEAVEQALAGASEADRLEAYIERRMPSIRDGVADDRRLAAAFRRLRRAGFASDAVLQALKRRSKNSEAIGNLPDPDEEEAPE